MEAWNVLPTMVALRIQNGKSNASSAVKGIVKDHEVWRSFCSLFEWRLQLILGAAWNPTTHSVLLGPASSKKSESCLMLYVMEKLEYKIGVPKRHANAKICAPREVPYVEAAGRRFSSTSKRLIRFFINSNAEKKIALTTQDRLIETLRPMRKLSSAFIIERSGILSGQWLKRKTYLDTFVDWRTGSLASSSGLCGLSSSSSDKYFLQNQWDISRAIC